MSGIVGSYRLMLKMVWHFLRKWTFLLGFAFLVVLVFNYSHWQQCIILPRCGFICISLVINEIERLFICIVAIIYLTLLGVHILPIFNQVIDLFVLDTDSLSDTMYCEC